MALLRSERTGGGVSFVLFWPQQQPECGNVGMVTEGQQEGPAEALPTLLFAGYSLAALLFLPHPVGGVEVINSDDTKDMALGVGSACAPLPPALPRAHPRG